MAKFLFAYRMPKGYEPGQSGAMEVWSAWFEGLGGAVVDHGNPTFESTGLGATPTDTRLGGYSIIEADDLESATTLAKGCPAVSSGGGVEVGLITEVM